eukprot:6195865-Pleurochrysis_carterae.AAC.6
MSDLSSLRPVFSATGRRCQLACQHAWPPPGSTSRARRVPSVREQSTESDQSRACTRASIKVTCGFGSWHALIWGGDFKERRYEGQPRRESEISDSSESLSALSGCTLSLWRMTHCAACLTSRGMSASEESRGAGGP